MKATPAASDVQLATQTLTVTLQDERQISVPLYWYPRLLAATEGERNSWELLGEGYAIMWPDLDEHIGVEGLLVGRRSAEKTGLARAVVSDTPLKGIGRKSQAKEAR